LRMLWLWRHHNTWRKRSWCFSPGHIDDDLVLELIVISVSDYLFVYFRPCALFVEAGSKFTIFVSSRCTDCELTKSSLYKKKMRSEYIQQGVRVYNRVFTTSAQPKGPIVSDKLTINIIQSQFFMTAVVLIWWAIWTARNDLIFEGIQPNVNNARSLFCNEILLLLHRVKSSLAVSFDQWVQNLV
jgi:hypothetical protein